MITQQEIDECTELTEKLFLLGYRNGHKLKDPKSILSRVINHLLKGTEEPRILRKYSDATQ